MDRALEWLIGTACVVIIVGGTMWLSDNVHCFNFFGLAKGCIIGK